MYSKCCGRFIEENKLPQTPEELMRSRYTAYTRANIDYIESTMLPPAADGFDRNDAYIWAKTVTWKKLQVINSNLDKGIVEFIAYFTFNRQVQAIHEKSYFIKQAGRWFYTDGETFQVEPQNEPGRNDPCYCGSKKNIRSAVGINLVRHVSRFFA